MKIIVITKIKCDPVCSFLCILLFLLLCLFVPSYAGYLVCGVCLCTHKCECTNMSEIEIEIKRACERDRALLHALTLVCVFCENVCELKYIH